ncbi:hypothetical protein N7539_008255 [Penicillium diatomitis]|uniref:Uncharacterized protein n=1 Tax=Penicillium diatomitis TaxID=2819901 RepID=A0A9W9WTH3_9EURO|nr:uncharacterized protein N7539_008255 [Penicillium diatomitis]KAJ5475189.1 hypothetical protein N7539_008255 [Penicillium diatomitis]
MIIGIITVHATRNEIAPTGLFGLLSDAPIQLIDLFDAKLVDRYLQLFENLRYSQGRMTCQFLRNLEDLTTNAGIGTREAQNRMLHLANKTLHGPGSWASHTFMG